MDAQANNERLIQWFKQWRKPIRSWLRNRRGVPSGEIDDLAQEVFLRLLRFSTETLVENPQGYLFRIAANVANEWKERCRVRRPHDDNWLEDLQISDELEPQNIFEREQERSYYQRRIDLLPPRQRAILLLHVNERMTYQQIAEARNLSYRIVLRDLTRAYANLGATGRTLRNFK